MERTEVFGTFKPEGQIHAGSIIFIRENIQYQSIVLLYSFDLLQIAKTSLVEGLLTSKIWPRVAGVRTLGAQRPAWVRGLAVAVSGGRGTAL
eukprot:SAG11_NODE_14912_length_594_cov_1.149194_1_plen_91_part_01